VQFDKEKDANEEFDIFTICRSSTDEYINSSVNKAKKDDNVYKITVETA